MPGPPQESGLVAGSYGYVVVNADQTDGLCLEEVKGEVVYYSAYPDNTVVRRHLGAGGLAVFVRGGKMIVAKGCCSRTITGTKIPGHKDIDANQLEDALAAAAGLMVLGVRPDEIWRSRCNRSQVPASREKFKKMVGK